MSYFEKVPKFKNLRGKTKHDGWYKVYNKSVKTDIAIHHSLTDWGDSAAFANYHVGTLGWPEVAYHFVILKDGTIEWNHDLGVLSYHVGNSNYFSVGICVVGDFRGDKEPTREQKESLRLLVAALKKDLPNYKRTRGHNEFPGYAWKACPEFDYKAVISGKDTGGAVKEASKTYLSKGDEGEDVRALQSSLSKIGFDLEIDGDYGPATEEVVRAFQEKYELSVDGIAGENTLNKLNNVIAKLAKRRIEEAERKEEEAKKAQLKDEPYYRIMSGYFDSIERYDEALKIVRAEYDNVIYEGSEVEGIQQTDEWKLRIYSGRTQGKENAEELLNKFERLFPNWAFYIIEA